MDDFTRQILRMIIAKAAQERGYGSISQSAFNTLVEAVIDRLRTYARDAAKFTTSCRRIDTNALDVFAALNLFHENTTTLANYVNDGSQIPRFDYYIQPYPIPRLCREKDGMETHPFRANTPISSIYKTSQDNATGDGCIPDFFSSLPKYTYDFNPPQETTGKTKIRENNQRLIKEKLSELMNNRHPGRSDNYSFELAEFTQTGAIAKPETQLLSTPLYTLTGTHPSLDPSFLSFQEVEPKDVGGDGSKEMQIMVGILNTNQAYDKIGAKTK